MAYAKETHTKITVIMTKVLLKAVRAKRARDLQGRYESLGSVVSRLVRVGIHNVANTVSDKDRNAATDQLYKVHRGTYHFNFIAAAPGIIHRADKPLLRLGVHPGMSLNAAQRHLSNLGYDVTGPHPIPKRISRGRGRPRHILLTETRR